MRFDRLKKLIASVFLLGACAYGQTTASVTVLGGEQSNGGVWDSGDVTITINGDLSRTVSYGQFSTPSSIAAGLAALISRECYGVASAKADGSTITVRLRYASPAPLVISPGTSHWDNGHFAGPSFSFGQQQNTNPTQVTLVGSTGELIAPGAQVGLTATIAQSGTTGTIAFYDRGALLGASAISNSLATYTTPPLAAGAHELYAKYSGDNNYAGSTSNTVYATAVNHTGPAIGSSLYWYTITADGGGGGYAANSNILAYNDAVMGKWTFGYDNSNRASSGNALSGPIPSQYGAYLCWNYDSFGNRLTQVISGQSFSISNGSTCQSNGVVSQTWENYDGGNRITNTNAPGYSANLSYDSSGNIVNDGKNVYLYDAEGRVCAVQAPPAVPGMPNVMLQYIYDGDGRRVGKGTISSWNCNTDTNGFVQTVAYVDGPDGMQMTELNRDASGSMAWLHTNVYAAGRLIATYQNDNNATTPLSGNLHFSLNDWLGTKRVQTASDGSFENSWINLPFGESQAGTQLDSTENHFTGKERDLESGLDYFGARYYSSAQGRWLSPEYSMNSAIMELPQTWNKYAYVYNRPTYATDPDGYCPPCIGAVVGGVVEGGVNFGSQLISNGGHLSAVNWREVGANALGGAVSGALAGATGGATLLESAVVGDVAAGGISNIVGGMVTRAAEGNDGDEILSASAISEDALAGFVGGAAGHIAGESVHVPDEPVHNGRRGRGARRRDDAKFARYNRALRTQITRAGIWGSVGQHITNAGVWLGGLLSFNPPPPPHPPIYKVTVSIINMKPVNGQP